MYHINLFGSGIRYWICKIPLDIFKKFEKIHVKYKAPYENIFFDLDLLNKYGFSNWSDIYNIDYGRGFFIKERNRIEIKQKTKRLARLDSIELLFSPLLIEPYKLIFDNNEIEKSNDFKIIILIQYEKGSFFKFQLSEDNFDIKKLSFHLNYANIQKHIGENFITTLSYNGQLLHSHKDDVVCTGQKVLLY